jgi:hypothetical protein
MIKNTRGGIGPKMEHWMEKYHQDGVKADMQFRMARSTELHARIILRHDAIRSIPEVQTRIQEKQKQHSRGKRKATVTQEEALHLAKSRR